MIITIIIIIKIIIIIVNSAKTVILLEMSCPLPDNRKSKSCKKMEKYAPLRMELEAVSGLSSETVQHTYIHTYFIATP